MSQNAANKQNQHGNKINRKLNEKIKTNASLTCKNF